LCLEVTFITELEEQTADLRTKLGMLERIDFEAPAARMIVTMSWL